MILEDIHMTDRGEYTPASDSPWRQALATDAALDRVMAEALDRIGKLGADETDKTVAAQILSARATLALADAVHSARQQLGLFASNLADLNRRVTALTDKPDLPR